VSLQLLNSERKEAGKRHWKEKKIHPARERGVGVGVGVFVNA